MAINTGNPYNAALDANQYPSLTVVSGTAGTADTSGTAETLRVGGNPATGAMYVQDLSGASGTSNVIVVAGTQQTLGTVQNVNNGSINVLTGTINRVHDLGTVGSIGNIGVVHSAGTLAAGDNNIGNVDVVTGTVTAVTTVSNLTNGSVRVTVGTITTGSLSNLAMLNAGTIDSVSNLVKGTITKLEGGTLGVVSSVSEVVKGTTTLVSTVTTVSNLTTGSIVLTSGTLGSVGAVAQVHNAGTIQAGTVQLNPVPVPATLTFGTLGTAGGSFFGTLSGVSGAGTKHYVTGVDIVMNSGTADVRVLAGSSIQGTGVLAAGAFPVGGGISNRIQPAFATGTNSELIYHFVGAGTAFIRISYWKGV